MIITSKIQTDLVLSGETPVVEAVQDDKYSRNLEISLCADGTLWEVPADTKAVVRYIKPDGTGGSYDTLPDGTSAYSISGSVITVALAPQVCTAHGLVRLVIGLIQTDAEVNTFVINLIVHRNPGIDAVSEDYTNMTAYVKAFGWEPNMYLSTDENGWVVSENPLERINETVEDVLDGILQATAISVVKEDDALSLTTTLENGTCSVSEITLDENGYPTSIVTDGVACLVSWEGF